MYKMYMKHTKICHFYAKLVKFRLILTHLKLFWGKLEGLANTFWGAKCFLGISCNQNNYGSSGAYVTCIYCSLSSLKINTARKDHGRIWFAFVFACVVGKNPKTPNLSPMADDAIMRSGISLVYLWVSFITLDPYTYK